MVSNRRTPRRGNPCGCPVSRHGCPVSVVTRAALKVTFLADGCRRKTPTPHHVTGTTADRIRTRDHVTRAATRAAPTGVMADAAQQKKVSARTFAADNQPAKVLAETFCSFTRPTVARIGRPEPLPCPRNAERRTQMPVFGAGFAAAVFFSNRLRRSSWMALAEGTFILAACFTEL